MPKAGSQIAIAIVGADPLARAGLASRLGRAPEIRVLADFDPHELAALPSRAQVVVWDAGALPGAMPEALELRLPVLALVTHADQGNRFLDAGVRGVIDRQAPLSQLVAAVRAVAQGLWVVDAAVAEAVLHARREQPHPATEPLTPRELEVLSLLSRGFANKRIATTLGISEHTAKFHVNSIFAKLGARGRTDAVVRAARLGLVVL